MAFLSVILLLALHTIPPSSSQQLLNSSFSAADSPWGPSQNRTLVSFDGVFAAGFRSQSLFAVWVQTSSDHFVVWSVTVSSFLTISQLGDASLNDSSGRNIFADAGAASGARLILNKDGSLVFGNWTSFASATNTILANQTVPANGTTLTSGHFRLVNATVLVYGKDAVYWGANSGRIRSLTSDGNITTDSGSFMAANVGQNSLRRLTLDNDGNLRLYSLHRTTGNWRMVWQAIQELCTIEGFCGHNAICIPDRADGMYCECPPGYRRNTTDTDSFSCLLKRDFSNTNSKFLPLEFVTFDRGPDVVDHTPLPFEACESSCRANSSCVGFSYQYTGTQSCKHYLNGLRYGYWSPLMQTAVYLRVAASETDTSNFTGMKSVADTICPVKISLAYPAKESKATARNLAILISVFVLEILLAFLSFWRFLYKYSKYQDIARVFGLEFLPAGGPKRFSYAELKAATNNFSNVIGKGAYGIVFKGELPDRRVIAVKRLRSVDTGETEFWAEVTIIARMHHLNLVRMWGFCAEKEQRLLVYEYIPNGSLDKYLFLPTNPEKKDTAAASPPPKPLLDWNIRYRIAVGVARAIAYLHEECLEWVLHCDIKPENILLEDDFCPKVSDFGLSKLASKEDNLSLSRVRGTPGYMAPEWVIRRDPITAKADVYSFGIVLLEIVTGVRNNDFRQSVLRSDEWYFPKWAYEKVYVERKVEDILDRSILESYDNKEHFGMVERMVKTATWCLQDRAEMRPSMGKVAKMLEGSVEIMEPGPPTIFYLS